MFWVPQSGNLGIGVSILSFNDKVHFGLITDAAMVPDPHAIIARFAPEFERLLYFVLMSAWGEETLASPAPELAQKRPRGRTKRARAPAKRTRLVS